MFEIVPDGFLQGDFPGIYHDDYLDEVPPVFGDIHKAEQWLSEHHKGPDVDGVTARFAIIPSGLTGASRELATLEYRNGRREWLDIPNVLVRRAQFEVRWQSEDSDNIPRHVFAAVRDEIAETDAEEGEVEVGGQRYEWRKEVK